MRQKCSGTSYVPVSVGTGKAWGKGLKEEFNAIKGFKVEDILGNKVEVIKDDKIIEGGSEGGGKQI